MDSLYTTAQYMWLTQFDDSEFSCSVMHRLVKCYFWLYGFLSVIVGLNALIILLEIPVHYVLTALFRITKNDQLLLQQT